MVEGERWQLYWTTTSVWGSTKGREATERLGQRWTKTQHNTHATHLMTHSPIPIPLPLPQLPILLLLQGLVPYSPASRLWTRLRLRLRLRLGVGLAVLRLGSGSRLRIGGGLGRASFGLRGWGRAVVAIAVAVIVGLARRGRGCRLGTGSRDRRGTRR